MSTVTGIAAADEGLAAGVGASHGHFERARGMRSGGLSTWLVRRWLGLKHWLPKGQLLPEHVLRRRHHSICVLLWLHVPVLFAFGMVIDPHSLEHVAGDVSLIALCGLGASLERFRLKAQGDRSIVRAGHMLRRCSSTCGAGSPRRTFTSSS